MSLFKKYTVLEFETQGHFQTCIQGFKRAWTSKGKGQVEDCKHGSWIKKLKIIIKTAKNYESVTVSLGISIVNGIMQLYSNCI